MDWVEARRKRLSYYAGKRAILNVLVRLRVAARTPFRSYVLTPHGKLLFAVLVRLMVQGPSKCPAREE